MTSNQWLLDDSQNSSEDIRQKYLHLSILWTFGIIYSFSPFTSTSPSSRGPLRLLGGCPLTLALVAKYLCRGVRYYRSMHTLLYFYHGRITGVEDRGRAEKTEGHDARVDVLKRRKKSQ